MARVSTDQWMAIDQLIADAAAFPQLDISGVLLRRRLGLAHLRLSHLWIDLRPPTWLAAEGMLRTMRLILVLTLATSVVATSAQQVTPPKFRAGVALTRLEVTVLDKKTRAPITGLTADDFIVKVNGRAQPVVSLAEVSVPGAANPATPGITESARDVVSNELTSPRLFVLVMNDALGGLEAIS